jgi:hypothetical protein
MVVGSVADVSEAHIESIFRVEMSRMGECPCVYRFLIQHTGDGGFSRPVLGRV